jgi:DNA adenine methylase
MVAAMRVPHPIPYQGSKRRLAPRILAAVSERRFSRLFEPFAGSAAITIAARNIGLANGYVLGDSLKPLALLWEAILDDPLETANDYESLWTAQLSDPREHFLEVREEFNRDAEPIKLLYLLTRCVKNAPRWNSQGDFNQSADHRRRGMNPRKMRLQIEGASRLLADQTEVVSGDFVDTLSAADKDDLVYLDPPWQGTSSGVDKRYHAWLARERLEEVLRDLNSREVPWLLSYDGRHGVKEYGEPLSEDLQAVRLEFDAGRSSQATLSGRTTTTVESLYVSSDLVEGRQRKRRLELAA